MSKYLKLLGVGILISLILSLGIFYTLYFVKKEQKDSVLLSKEVYRLKDNLKSVGKDFVTLLDKEGPTEIRPVDQNNVRIIEDGWELVWEDDFDGAQLNKKKWNIEDWAADKNNELQYYSPNNIKVESGMLKLISKKESLGGRDYTSGAIHSKGKFSFLYGKVEMRAKLPRGQGLFPAFWTMTNQEHTWLPEIDIVEMLGHKPEEIWMVLHWLDDNNTLTSVSTSYQGEDYSKEFHTFGLEWTPNYVSWFIDGVERFKTTKFIPQEEMYLYMNTAIGGNWPGSPDESTSFPAVFEIDYVRVYKINRR